MPIRFVTIVTPDFWPGFAALLQSLGENAGLGEKGFEIVAICDEAQAPKAWLAGRSEKIQLFPLAELPKIELLSAQNQGTRMENAMQKLGVFALPEDWGTCIYIDADIVCLRSLAGIAEFVPFTAAPDMPMMSDELPGDPLADPSFDYNTGLFVFAPNATIFRQLQGVYEKRHHERTHAGDQDVFNLWVREQGIRVNLIGSEWNFAKRYQDFLGSRRCRELLPQIKMLHYVGVKPWTDNASVTTFRECHYRWMEEIWWDYFERSGLAEHINQVPDPKTAFRRQWLLPWTHPPILKEHWTRGGRLVRRLLRGNGPADTKA